MSRAGRAQIPLANSGRIRYPTNMRPNLLCFGVEYLTGCVQQPHHAIINTENADPPLIEAFAHRRDLGTFILKDDDVLVRVKLYCLDWDGWYPNRFSLHTGYQVGEEAWKHVELFSGTRVGFLKILAADAKAIQLQLRSTCRLSDRMSAEDVRRIYEPITMTLVLQEGVPILK